MNLLPQAILFDLDGTLLDTAPDLLSALNQLRIMHHLPLLSLTDVRPIISSGSKIMLKHLLGITEEDARFPAVREHFFKLYENQLSNQTVFFPYIEKVLSYCETNHIPWGIVTNKLTRHAKPLLEKRLRDYMPHCLVCGDTLKTYKPHPDPIRHACALLNKHPTHCWYVGDSLVDMQASKSAGTHAILAAYGYIAAEDDIAHWQADRIIYTPKELLMLLQSLHSLG